MRQVHLASPGIWTSGMDVNNVPKIEQSTTTELGVDHAVTLLQSWVPILVVTLSIQRAGLVLTLWLDVEGQVGKPVKVRGEARPSSFSSCILAEPHRDTHIRWSLPYLPPKTSSCKGLTIGCCRIVWQKAFRVEEVIQDLNKLQLTNRVQTASMRKTFLVLAS